MYRSHAIALVLITFIAGCGQEDEAPKVAAASSPTTAAGTTKPTTRLTVPVAKLLWVPASGAYVAGGTRVEVAMDFDQTMALVDRHLAALVRRYRDPKLRESVAKLYLEEGKSWFGTALRIDAPKAADQRPTIKLFFLGKRSYVEINQRLRDRVSATRGKPTDFDPRASVTYFAHPLWYEDDEPLSIWVVSGDVAFAERLDTGPPPRKVACLILSDEAEPIVLDAEGDSSTN